MFLEQTPKIKFADGIQMLIDSGWLEEDGSAPKTDEDLSLKAEKALGRVVKERYNTDYYILGQWYNLFDELLAHTAQTSSLLLSGLSTPCPIQKTLYVRIGPKPYDN